ncbi:hypothetical protein MOF05_20780 [Bacillus haynesii]|uniref:hypothetical protein n=1 Tax=Bacillus haynesii TaxID=1925021 RepID=UPI0022801FAB|nr:hypothetical protein [Bacillus haynesii]MCY9290788.1 hypothetical protein [Bacillus haynesii]
MKNKFVLGCLGVIVVFILVVVIAAAVIWGQRGEAVSLETQIEAQLKSNESNYDAMWKKFKEMTQVTDLQAEQFKDVYSGLVSGRYGDSKLLFKAVQEQNPNLSGEVYTKLQNEISAARTEFDRNQKKITDMIAEYNRLVQHRGILMSLMTGRKPLDTDKYIVTSDNTQKAFDSGKADTIDLKGDK